MTKDLRGKDVVCMILDEVLTSGHKTTRFFYAVKTSDLPLKSVKFWSK